VDRLHATPLVPAKGRSKAVPTCFDTVLVRVGDANENQHTKGTCLEGVSINLLNYFAALHLMHVM